MTIDEAIKHCEEVASQCEFDTDWGIGNNFIDRSGVIDVIECGAEHRQLAEWLTELKLYRETLIGRPCEVCKFHKTGSCSRWECVFEEVNADDRNRCENYRK